MATAATVSLTPDTSGVLHIPTSQLSQDSCKLASQLLQKNHNDYHMYFNQSGFHNHIAHHLLTIFALGATPPQIQKAYDDNATYQRPQFPVDKDTVSSMADPALFAKYLGNERYFHDYEIFFRKEIEKHNGNYGAMLKEQLLSDTPQAKDLLVRMFAGFYHPIIHLGFGVEFEQPAIITEALAQAATHDNWPAAFITTTTEKADKRMQANENPRPLVDLIHEARSTPKIRESPHWEDGNKLRDGVLKRAMPEITDLCSQWHVKPTKDDLRLKTAEMINAACYFAGAAQHSSHQKAIKWDFFYMHCVNCSIFYSAFLDSRFDDWLSDEMRAQLLMYKGWSDLAMYVSRGAPELFIDEISEYKPKQPSDGWHEIFARVDELPDDGHASKLVRALANGERVCGEYEGKAEAESWQIKGNMWLGMAHMAIDSVEGTTSKWARNVGFEQAWKDVPERGAREENVTGSKGLNGVAEGYHEKF
ncbi:hypothetical protein PMZ80_006234 [Knufia obscura]|uniref:Uncharacterized protein n=1 Tax=Knufia obscura TaxID=1635080 RepID=A0ABR0RKV2_9EURO|nr:hypothetical protein PMZ80_006234 [Knufia obscura]